MTYYLKQELDSSPLFTMITNQQHPVCSSSTGGHNFKVTKSLTLEFIRKFQTDLYSSLWLKRTEAMKQWELSHGITPLKKKRHRKQNTTITH